MEGGICPRGVRSRFGGGSMARSIDEDNKRCCSWISGSESIYESAPITGTGLTYAYRTDGAGDSSNNTGFFFLFKQGNLQYTDFSVESATTNFIKSIDVSNINDTDIWLYQLDQFGQLSKLWTQVPALSGNNAIYNSLAKTQRDIYNVVTKNNDQIENPHLIYPGQIFKIPDSEKE